MSYDNYDAARGAAIGLVIFALAVLALGIGLGILIGLAP